MESKAKLLVLNLLKNEYLWRRSLVKTPGMIFTEKKRVNYWLLDESILQLRIPNSFGGKKTNRVFGCRSTLTANKTKGYVTMQKMSWLYKQDLWFCKCQILDFSIWIIASHFARVFYVFQDNRQQHSHPIIALAGFWHSLSFNISLIKVIKKWL